MAATNLGKYTKEQTKAASQGQLVPINTQRGDGWQSNGTSILTGEHRTSGGTTGSGTSYSSGINYGSGSNYGSGTSLSSSTNKYSSLADDYAAKANSVNLNIPRQAPDMTAYYNYSQLANNFMQKAANAVSTNTTRGQVGANRYQNIYESAYAALANRDKFSYNQKDDPLYAQYEDMYTRNARMAMNDTIGVASAMTGGYGNSYAATAGQSMYNNTMQGLNEKALQLYDSALNTYNSETNRLATNFDAAANMYGTEQNNLQFIANLTENQYQYDQSYAQNERNMLYNIAMNYSQMGEGARQFDTSFAEQKHQNDVSNALNTFTAYNNAASNYYGLYESARATDLDNSYKYAALQQADRHHTEEMNQKDREFAENLNYNYTTSGFDYDPVTGKATRSEWYNNERAEDQAYRWASAGLNYDPTTGKVTRSDIASQDYSDSKKQSSLNEVKALYSAGDYEGASRMLSALKSSGVLTDAEVKQYNSIYGNKSYGAGANERYVNNVQAYVARGDYDGAEAYINSLNAEEYVKSNLRTNYLGNTATADRVDKNLEKTIITRREFENVANLARLNSGHIVINGKLTDYNTDMANNNDDLYEIYINTEVKKACYVEHLTPAETTYVCNAWGVKA